MKNINKIIGLIVVFLLTTNIVTAQKMDAYVMKMPSLYFGGGGSIYVKPLENKGEINDDFSTKYPEYLVYALNMERYGAAKNATIHNPWLTTKLYEIVEDEAQADYVIAGEYSFTKGSSKSTNDKVIKEKMESLKPQLPIHYIEYVRTSSAAVTGKLVLLQDEKVLRELPFDTEQRKSESKALKVPSVPSPESLMGTVENHAIGKYQFYFSPKLVLKNYNFKNLRGADRSYNKELRNVERDIKDWADEGEIMKMGKAYKEILTHELKDTDQAHLNMGMCYEIIGNYTKALEHYEKSGDSESINSIKKMINERDIYKDMGVEIIEKDFE